MFRGKGDEGVDLGRVVRVDGVDLVKDLLDGAEQGGGCLAGHDDALPFDAFVVRVR